jgi:hypothetical protein
MRTTLSLRRWRGVFLQLGLRYWWKQKHDKMASDSWGWSHKGR